jgi:mono/diheme cytochrome c family protein
MKFIKFAFILLTVTIFIIACAQTKTTNTNAPANTVIVANAPAQPVATKDEIATTKAIFLESCVGCHRENGEGGAAEFEGKKIKVPSFQSKGAMNASDDKLYDYIANGEENEMPAFKDKLTEEQMRNLVKFIRKEFQKK